MNKINLAVLGLMTISFFMGCQGNVNRSHKEADYRSGPFYFSKADKVDNEKIGPHIYRLENDEVVCYSGGSEQGLQCKWKVQ